MKCGRFIAVGFEAQKWQYVFVSAFEHEVRVFPHLYVAQVEFEISTSDREIGEDFDHHRDVA